MAKKWPETVVKRTYNTYYNYYYRSLISHWKIAGFGTDVKSEESIRMKLSKIIREKVEEKLKSSKLTNRLFDTEWIAKKQVEFNSPFDLAKGPPTPVKQVDAANLNLVS